MRDTKRFVSGKLMGLVNITCPGCNRKFRVALAKIELPAVCTFCNTLVERPADHHREPQIQKLKIPLKGTIVTTDGSVDLEDVEAESDAYTGGRRGFTDAATDPTQAMAQASAEAHSRRMPGSGRKNTRRIRAVTYKFATIAMITLVVVAVAVFIWQMIVHFGTPTP